MSVYNVIEPSLQPWGTCHQSYECVMYTAELVMLFQALWHRIGILVTNSNQSSTSNPANWRSFG